MVKHLLGAYEDYVCEVEHPSPNAKLHALLWANGTFGSPKWCTDGGLLHPELNHLPVLPGFSLCIPRQTPLHALSCSTMIVWTQLWTQSHSSPAFTSVNVRTCMQCLCAHANLSQQIKSAIIYTNLSTHIQRWVTEPGLQSGSECLHKLDWDPRPRQAFSTNSNLQYILRTTSCWVASFPGPPSFLSLAVRKSLSIFHLS